jgi:hypothetical protein
MRASVVVIASAMLFAPGIVTATALPSRSGVNDVRHLAALSGKAPCGKGATLALVRNFVSAFNRGDGRALNRAIASASEFRWYAVNAAPAERVQGAAKDRRSLIGYFAARHRQSERLTLKSLGFVGYSLGKDQFTFTAVRTAADLDLPTTYGGKGAINCWGHRGISVWAMGPATAGYSVPEALLRPLHLPKLGPGGTCPVTAGQRFDNGQFGGVTLGQGPVQPLLAPVTGADSLLQGVVPLQRYRLTAWLARGQDAVVRVAGLPRSDLHPRTPIGRAAPACIRRRSTDTARLAGRPGSHDQWRGRLARVAGCDLASPHPAAMRGKSTAPISAK